MKFIIVILILFLPILVLAQPNERKKAQVDSLMRIVKTTDDDLLRIKAYTNWDDLIFISNPKQDRNINLQIVKIAERNCKRTDISKKDKLEFEQALANSLNNLAFYYKDHGDSEKAKKSAEKAFEISTRNNDSVRITNSLNALAIISEEQGDHAKAIEIYTRCLLIHEARGDLNGMAQMKNNIGTIYYIQKNRDEAMKYFRASLRLCEKIGKNSQNYSISLSNIGNILFLRENYDSCMYYYEKAMKLKKELGDEQGVANSLNGIGLCYDKLGRFEEAISNFEESLRLSEKLDDKKGIAGSLYVLGEIYFAKKNFSKAIEFQKRALEISIEQKLFVEALNSSEALFQNYHKMGLFKEALEMHILHIEMKDSLNSDANKKAILEQGLKYEYEKKKAIDEKEKEKQKAINEEQEMKQNVIIYSISGGLILVILFAFFIVNRLRITNYQKKTIEQQKHLVDEKQKEITDSINYAKRIQYSLLAHEEMLKANLQEYFILFQPKDIVSGDFYWCTKKDRYFYLAICDCTGHGVPGAFMSLLNISFLNEAINEKNILEPHLVLNHVRQRLIENMECGQDGMDAALVRFENSSGKIQYSAAHNRPVLIRNGELKELPADKMPVGKGEKTDSFTLHEMELQKADQLFFYTDGFADQFGGEKGKKFKYSNLQKLLLENADLEHQTLNLKLSKIFSQWKGDLEQVDDVCVIGIRV